MIYPLNGYVVSKYYDYLLLAFSTTFLQLKAWRKKWVIMSEELESFIFL
jgi:hypothetical protein